MTAPSVTFFSSYICCVFPAEDFYAKEIKADAIKPYRIEANIGVPSILGLSFEWVLPFYVFKSHRLAVDLDFSYIPYFFINFDPGYVKFTNVIYSGLFIKYYL